MANLHKSDALIVLSGGQDSATVAALARTKHDRVHAITFDYGQRHAIEIEAAKEVAALLELDSHEIISLGGDILKSSSPLVKGGGELGKYDSADELPGGIEPTFVPARNLLFLTIAANRAIALEATAIYTGVCQEDFGGYPDCTQSFINKMGRAINQGIFGTIYANAEHDLIELVTPLMHLTKAQTVKLACDICKGRFSFDRVMRATHTCYDGVKGGCGRCHACILRNRGFKDAQIDDPLWGMRAEPIVEELKRRQWIDAAVNEMLEKDTSESRKAYLNGVVWNALTDNEKEVLDSLVGLGLVAQRQDKQWDATRAGCMVLLGRDSSHASLTLNQDEKLALRLLHSLGEMTPQTDAERKMFEHLALLGLTNRVTHNETEFLIAETYYTLTANGEKFARKEAALSSYGAEAISEAADQPLETWPIESSESPLEVHLEHPEFTSLCPRSAYPDSGCIVFDYVPRDKVIELKAFKLYINSFRNRQISHEEVIKEIAARFEKDVDPIAFRVIGDFMRRGGVKTVITQRSNSHYCFPAYQAGAL